MSYSNNTTVTEDLGNSSPVLISHSVRFWYFLCWNILSLGCTLITLYFLLFNRTLRHALHNHIFIVLLLIGLIDELTNISWFIHNYQYDTPWQASSSFYLFWTFFGYSMYSLQVELFAWATIERHILIFHDQWVSTRKKRLFIHYLPIVIIIIYYLIYYSLVYFGKPCGNSFDGFLTGGSYIPCAFDKKLLGIWDIIFHQLVPTLIIVIFCITLLLRVIKQKIRMRQLNNWRKHRKMTIQLLSISTIYMIFNIPQVSIIIAYQFGLSQNVARYGLVYGKFLTYNIIFLFPFVCCLSLSELRTKIKEKILFCRQRQRRVGIITGTTANYKRNTQTAEHYNYLQMQPL